MKTILFVSFTGVMCILMLAAGCTTASGTTAPATTTPAPVSVATTAAIIPAATTVTGPTWTGTWDSTFDGDASKRVMILVQVNDTVTGTYAYNDGRISGTVQGNHLIGKWFEGNGVEADRNAGPIDWVMSSDYTSFEGTWAYGEDGPDALIETPSQWKGTRTA